MSEKVHCNFCRKSFGTPFQFFKHANKSHLENILNDAWLPCHGCELLLPSEDALSAHSAQAHAQSTDKSNTQERVQCQFCSDTFCSIQQYYKHANKAHTQLLPNNWHCCQVCNFYLPTIMALTNHKGRAHITNRLAPKRVQCVFCSDTICSLQQYYKHANKEHRENVAKNWHMCTTCHFYLPTSEALTNHNGKAHQARNPNQCTERIPCSFCSDTLCSLQQYYRHANKEHFDIVSNDWHMCSTCSFFLPTAVALTNHKGRAHAPMKASSKRVTCSFCPEVFRSADEYHAHANNIHMDLIVDKWQIHCKLCWIYFPTSLVLKRHKEQYHPNVKGLLHTHVDMKNTYYMETTIEVSDDSKIELE